MTLRSGGIRASSRFSCRKMWTGVKWKFSSPRHHVQNIVRKLSIRRVRMWNFTRIGSKTKKLWLSIVPVQRPSEQPGLGPPQRCELQLFFPGIQQAIRRLKALHLGRFNTQFRQDWPNDKKIIALLIFFARKLRKISLDWALWCGSRGIDNLSLSQHFWLYQWKSVN